jgi:hypothetical protein
MTLGANESIGVILQNLNKSGADEKQTGKRQK